MQPVSPLAPDAPRPGSRVRWTSLHGSARGLAVAGLVQRARTPVLVITGDSPAAHRIETELGFYLDGRAELLRFPDWETLPYDLFSPHQDIVSERLDTLARLPELASGVLVTPVTTAMGRLAPRGFVAGHRFRIERGDRLDIGAFRRRLDEAGYACVSQVMEHGEYAVRGSLFDLFPMGAGAPIRIDLLDDEIESLRTFDPDSQRSAGRIDRIDLLPAREFPTSPEAVSRFRRAWRRRFEGDPSRCPMYREVSQGRLARGHRVLPAAVLRGDRDADGLSPARRRRGSSPRTCTTRRRRSGLDTRERYENRRHDRERPVLAPNEIFHAGRGAVLCIRPAIPACTCAAPARAKANPAAARVSAKAKASSSPRRRDVRGVPAARAADRRAGGPSARLPAGLPRRASRALPRRGGDAGTAGRCVLETLGAHGLKPAIVESWSEFIAGSAGLAMTVAGLARTARASTSRPSR